MKPIFYAFLLGAVLAGSAKAESEFRTRLEPHGNWLRIDASLQVWQPRTAARNPDWRPYYDAGRWDWTEGRWVWKSDEAWGDIVFRQGRWWKAPRIGWVWVPDDHRGPAWVTWRYSNSHWGWAPLPPPVTVQQRIAASPFCRGAEATFYSRAPGTLHVFVPTGVFTRRSDWHSHAVMERRAAGIYSVTRSVPCGPSPFTVGVSSGRVVSSRTESDRGGHVEIRVDVTPAPVVLYHPAPVWFHLPSYRGWGSHERRRPLRSGRSHRSHRISTPRYSPPSRSRHGPHSRIRAFGRSEGRAASRSGSPRVSTPSSSRRMRALSRIPR